MLIGKAGGTAAPGGAGQKSHLHQVGLTQVLQRHGLLAQRRRQREEAERREQARTSRDRRQRTTQLERQSLMGPMDLPFLLLTLLLTGVGLVMVFSASFPSAYYETGDGA